MGIVIQFPQGHKGRGRYVGAEHEPATVTYLPAIPELPPLDPIVQEQNIYRVTPDTLLQHRKR